MEGFTLLEQHFLIEINATRNGVLRLPPELQHDEARRNVKMFLVPADASQTVSDRMIPDYLVSESMIDRYLEIMPPVMAVTPVFQEIIDKAPLCQAERGGSGSGPTSPSRDRTTGKRRTEPLTPYYKYSFATPRLSYPSNTCTTRIFFSATGESCPIGI